MKQIRLILLALTAVLVSSCYSHRVIGYLQEPTEKNGLPPVGVHGLRHSFCSVALSTDVGMTEREVMEIGGWEDYQTVHKIYEHLSDKHRQEAAKKFSAFFQSADEIAHDTQKSQ